MHLLLLAVLALAGPHQELYKSGCVELHSVNLAAKSELQATLEEIAAALKEEKDLRLKIIVHEVGKDHDQAKKRAEAIKTWLLRATKIAPARLSTETIAAEAQAPEGCHVAPGYVVNLD